MDRLPLASDQDGVVLSFKLFRIPVEVRPSFLLIAVFLGFGTGRVDFVVAWVLVIFVSILVHELGHALTARSFGSEVAIQLNAIGGLTSWTIPDQEIGPGRRALVAASGSAVGLLFGGIVWLAALPFGPFTGLTRFVLTNLVFVNVFWGLLNWLPIRPLDGGHLLTSLLDKFAPERGERIANAIFLVTAAAALAAAVIFQLLFVGLIAAWLLWEEINRGRPRQPSVPIPVMDFDSGIDERGDPNDVIEAAEENPPPP